MKAFFSGLWSFLSKDYFGVPAWCFLLLGVGLVWFLMPKKKRGWRR